MSGSESNFPQVLTAMELELRGQSADGALLEAITHQLNKDLSSDLVVVPMDPLRAIKEWSGTVSAVLSDPAANLQAILYRVDVPEYWAKEQNSMQQLAQVIVIRCAQKVIARRSWNSRS